MEYNQIAKQMIDFQKLSFDNWYSAVTLVQDQAASAMDMMLDQATWIPEEGRQAMLGWISVCQEERDRLKTYVDQSFTSLEKYVAEGKKATTVKTKKPATA